MEQLNTHFSFDIAHRIVEQSKQLEWWQREISASKAANLRYYLANPVGWCRIPFALIFNRTSLFYLTTFFSHLRSVLSRCDGGIRMERRKKKRAGPSAFDLSSIIAATKKRTKNARGLCQTNALKITARFISTPVICPTHPDNVIRDTLDNGTDM